MRRQYVILVAVISAVVAIAFAILVREPSELTYRGRTLSDWIVATRVHPNDEEARLAMRHVASHSIPLILEWLKREDRPTPKARIAVAKDWAITFLERHRVIKPQSHRTFMDYKGSCRVLAQWALEELGRDAREAVPALVQMLGMKGPSRTTSITAGTAYILLPKLAPTSIAALIDSLSSTDLQVGALAAGALGDIGPSARAAIPSLQTSVVRHQRDD